MTLNEIDQLSGNELQALILILIMRYSCHVSADFSDIKYWADMFRSQQLQLEEAVEALKRENNE